MFFFSAFFFSWNLFFISFFRMQQILAFIRKIKPAPANGCKRHGILDVVMITAYSRHSNQSLFLCLYSFKKKNHLSKPDIFRKVLCTQGQRWGQWPWLCFTPKKFWFFLWIFKSTNCTVWLHQHTASHLSFSFHKLHIWFL